MNKLPEAMGALPVDDRSGLPVPWSSAVLSSGRPDFTTVARDRALKGARERLCGVCGGPLGYWLAFLGTLKAAQLATFHGLPAHSSTPASKAGSRSRPHRRKHWKPTSTTGKVTLPACPS